MMAGSTVHLRPRHYLLLVLVTLALLLPGRMRLPPMDRDESRYLQATSQMLQTGNLIDIRFQDQPRYLQPAGIYWLEAAAVKLLGHPDQAWPYRVPSLLSGVLAVLLTAWIGDCLFGASAAWAAGLLLACAVLFGVEGRLAKIDATLLACVLCAQAMLLRLFLDREAGLPSRPLVAAGYWAALGCGLMLKGPVALLVSWGTLLGLALVERDIGWWRRLRAGWGVPLMLAIVLPWCIAIWHISGGTFFHRAVGHNFLGKLANGQETHGHLPGFYLLAFILAFWPGSLPAFLALPFAWRRRATAPVRFLLAWILPCWLVFELIATKLPHYVLPAYPAIACLTGAAMQVGASAGVGNAAWRWARRCYALIWILLTTGLSAVGPIALLLQPALPWLIHAHPKWPEIVQAAPWPALFAEAPWAVIAASAALGLIVSGLGVVCLRSMRRSRPKIALLAISSAALLMSGNVYLLILPRLDSLWLSPRIATAVSVLRPCPDSLLFSSAFSEPSLVFLTEGRARLDGVDKAAQNLMNDPACGLALVGQKDIALFKQKLSSDKIPFRLLTEISGLNYSTGKWLDLSLFSAGRAAGGL